MRCFLRGASGGGVGGGVGGVEGAERVGGAVQGLGRGRAGGRVSGRRCLGNVDVGYWLFFGTGLSSPVLWKESWSNLLA